MSKMRMVPQVDADGFFTGFSTADESPLEPGVYLLGAGAIDAAPPPREALPHEAIRRVGNVWQYVPDYSQATLYSTETAQTTGAQRGQSLAELRATLLAPKPGQTWNPKKECWAWTLQQVKEMRLAELAALRWQVQCAGVRVTGIAGVTFASSPDDRARLKTTIEDADIMGDEVVNFKAQTSDDGGWVDLTIEQLQKAVMAIVEHTKACYNAERSHAEAIALLTTEEDVQAYNMASGWPV